jgi:hypothetical protein
MFDRTACPDAGLLAAQPYVSIEVLAALSALLDLALKDQTPSAVLLSVASGAAIGAPTWPELPAEARAALTNLMTQLILDHAATTATPRAKEVGHDL